MGHITALQYLERIPDGYIPARRALINELKQAQRQQMLTIGIPPRAEDTTEGDVAEQELKPDIPTGGGYSALQRKVNLTDSTSGLV